MRTTVLFATTSRESWKKAQVLKEKEKDEVEESVALCKSRLANKSYACLQRGPIAQHPIFANSEHDPALRDVG